MLKLTAEDIIEVREPTQESENDWEREIVFARDGRRYRVTVFARADYGPRLFCYAVADDDTGDSLFDTRIAGRTSGDQLCVNLAVVNQLARDLLSYVEFYGLDNGDA